MPQENMWKIGHPELDISPVEIISVMKWSNEQTDRNAKIVIIWRECKNIPGMSPDNLTKLAHPKLAIFTVNIISVRKWGNKQTDRHTRTLRLFWKSAETSKKCIPKIWKR